MIDSGEGMAWDVWKPLEEFPGYEISMEGVIRDKYNQRILSARGGTVVMQKGKTRYTRTVAKLLRDAWS